MYEGREFEVGESWIRDECISCKCVMEDGVSKARCSELCNITMAECSAKASIAVTFYRLL